MSVVEDNQFNENFEVIKHIWLDGKSLNKTINNFVGHFLIDNMLCFHVGDCIKLKPVARRNRPNSAGGNAWVKCAHDDNTLNVEYVLDRQTSKEVLPSHVSNVTLNTKARKHSSSDVPIQPSLLSPSHQIANNVLWVGDLVHVKKKKVGLKNNGRPYQCGSWVVVNIK